MLSSPKNSLSRNCIRISSQTTEHHFITNLALLLLKPYSTSVLKLELAQAVVDAGAIPLLVLCIQEPEISVKRISASALSDICKHSPEVFDVILIDYPVVRMPTCFKQ